MKKITLLSVLLTYAFGYAQDNTLGIFTEVTTTEQRDLNIQKNGLDINEEFSDTGADGGLYVMEAKGIISDPAMTNYQAFSNFPSTNRLDLTNYTHFHISIKSESPQPIILRMEDNANTQANITDLAAYGFAYDNEWHTLSIPIADFEAQQPAFDRTTLKNLFYVKSVPGSGGDVDAATYIFFIDHIYFSDNVNAVLSDDDFKTASIGVSLNSSGDEITVTSKDKIETITIYNLAGKKVLSSNESENLNISSFKTGAYIINATIEGKNITSKFLKK